MTNGRQAILIDHIDELRAAFRYVLDRYPFTLDAVVVLPDHLHCLWTLQEGDDDYSTRWRLLKSFFSKHIKTPDINSTRQLRQGERGVWQRRFWEHLIRDDDDYARHVDYIHFNPVKHGYVKQANDWPHSSFQRFVKQGIYSVKWGAGAEIKNMMIE